ncbi:DUF1700 domain-containing protein [Butyricicoccus sp.]|uniref:DUF1700 domain-containing protein n=1 Tax=Butyricicoccus sp. TaxID=2049021 RepID=UPI003736E1A0
MNRNDFILRLEQALAGMPEEERRRAVEYYENYFDEAGPENEAEVLHTLGAPEKVAADILKEFRDVSSPAGSAENTGKTGQKGAESYAERAKKRFQTMDNGQKALVLVLAAVAVICVVPASVGIVGGIGGILIGLICAVATVFLIVPVLDLAAWGCAIGFVVAAGYTAAAGTGAETLLFIGLALVSAALGILLWKLTVYLFRALFPALLNGIVGLFRRVFHRS